MMNFDKAIKVIVALALAIMASVSAFQSTWIQQVPVEEPVSRTAQTNVYTEQGGDKFVVASGGEIEIQSGGVLDLQSGSSLTNVPVCGSASFTGTTSVSTGFTTTSYAVATMATDPSTDDGAPWLITIDQPSTTTLNINAWQDAGTAATSTVTVDYCAVGTP